MAKKEKKRTRAANGMGTVRQRKDGRYEARYTGPDGRQRSIYAASAAEAKRKLKKAQAELTLGIWFEGSHATVAEWIDAWMANCTRHLKATTKADYTAYFTRHVKPVIGDVKLSRLKPIHIERVFSAMADKGLKVSTQKSCKIALSSALSKAVRDGMIASNPCSTVKLGKMQNKELVIVDRTEMAQFVTEAKKHRLYGVAMILAMQTGLRESELCGLRWSDIDLDAKRLYVRQQINRVEGKHIVQETKGYQVREIVLIDDMIALLKQHRVDQAQQILSGRYTAKSDLSDDLVFRGQSGGVMSAGGFYSAVKTVGKRAGIDGLHPHSLRDSYAVAALRARVDIKTIQNNLGHKDGSITINTYMRDTSDMGQIAADKYAAYWAENSAR